MTVTKFQPTLPSSQPFTEAELNFMDEEPPRLFPQNQNSNWGLLRRIFSNRMQQLIDQITTLYNEKFVATSTVYLGNHEAQMGLPVAPSGMSIGARRQRVLSRIQIGPFTRGRRNAVIESFILATFGDPIQFTPDGVLFTSGGIPFFVEAGSLSTLYAVTESVTTFHYQVRIKNTITLDDPGLHRELDRVTPGGLSYDVVYVATP